MNTPESTLKPVLVDLTDPQVLRILGQPNFMCARTAQVLRLQGHDIQRKAEHEQSYVIAWYLQKYVEHGPGEQWATKVNAELREITAAHKELV